MKVYVATMSALFGEERYIGVAASRKKAEKLLRDKWPHMRKDEWSTCYYADKKKDLLLFIHEEEI